MDVIDEIRTIIVKQKLNPSFNIHFDANILRKDYQKVLSEDLCCNVVM
jgi:hypothetical protein